MSGNIPNRDQKILCLKSGNRCALPDCRRILTVDGHRSDKESIVGAIAHIVGENPTSARYNSELSDKEKNAYGNLILVCCNCHKVIDDHEGKYTIEKLHHIKKDHEEWIIESTKTEVINVSFLELEVVTKYLTSTDYKSNDSFTVIAPGEKIIKNHLSQKISRLISMGLTQAEQVADFLNKYPDQEFGERLKQRFVDEYEKLRDEDGLNGDELFERLLDFSANGSNDFKIKAAGLTVLVYLFEKCEVFEK